MASEMDTALKCAISDAHREADDYHKAGRCGPASAMLGVVNGLLKARATLSRLPTYEDTKERFVPGADPCWVLTGSGQVVPGRDIEPTEHGWRAWGGHPAHSSMFFSTEASAAAHAATLRGEG